MSTKIKRTLFKGLEGAQFTDDQFFQSVRNKKKPIGVIDKIKHGLGKHLFGITDQTLDPIFGLDAPSLLNSADRKTASKLQAIYTFIDFMWRRSKLPKTSTDTTTQMKISPKINIVLNKDHALSTITISVNIGQGHQYDIQFYTNKSYVQNLPKLSQLDSGLLKTYVKNRKKDVNKIYSEILEFVKTLRTLLPPKPLRAPPQPVRKTTMVSDHGFD